MGDQTTEANEMPRPPMRETAGGGSSQTSLRRRRMSSQKSKSKKWTWAYRIPPELTKAQETTFLNMQLRKTDRALTGTKHRNTNYEFFVLAVFLVIIYSIGSTANENETGQSYVVTLTLGQIIIIGVWLLVATFVTTTFKESHWIELLYWMIVYLPFLAVMLTFVFDGQTIQEDAVINTGGVIGLSLIVAEALALLIFVIMYYVYPKYINSKSFRSESKAAHFWKIKMLGDWTMTYRGIKGVLGRRCTCKYHGETNQDGLPHGLGEWFDDSYDGEVLAGTWREGVPIAPFVSRHYGRGDAFSAVRVAYMMASDDNFTSHKFWPTAEKPARCGIAGVECSVSGSFYNELPCARELMEQTLFDEKTSVSDLLSNLTHVGQEVDTNILKIDSNDPRGVQINGLVHEGTGKTFNTVDEIVIKLKPEEEDPQFSVLSPRPAMQYMPMASARAFGHEKLVSRDEDLDVSEEPVEVSPAALPSVDETKTEDNDEEEENKVETGFPVPQRKLHLSVQGWKPAEHKDALVYLGGFNCPLKDNLENIGQFLAMTKLDAHIYPILFAWPVGTVLSYHSASRASHREDNLKHFLKLMRGLQNAGIRNVHLMSHSMGAQSLLSAFCDKPDGSRSDVSRCFRLAPDCDEEGEGIRDGQEGGSSEIEDDDSLLICRTLTMLNPDFPVSPFVNHAFRSVRRICQTITLVGDREDGALYFSELVNGVAVRCGYKQPDALLPNTENKEHLGYLKVIGRELEDLHFSSETQPAQKPESTKTAATSTAGLPSTRTNGSDVFLQFAERAPLTLVSEERELDKAWLDIDVIDTTGLDTNIANIRHNAFLLNPLLLNDLDELIRTGQRAMKRSSLLYRDGNMFSYCHAPSYVAAG